LEVIKNFFLQRKTYVAPSHGGNHDSDAMDVRALEHGGKHKSGKKGDGKNKNKNKGKFKGDTAKKGKPGKKGQPAEGAKNASAADGSTDDTKINGYCRFCGAWGHPRKQSRKRASVGASGKPGGTVAAVATEVGCLTLEDGGTEDIYPDEPDFDWVMGLTVNHPCCAVTDMLKDRARMMLDSGSGITGVTWDTANHIDTMMPERELKLSSVSGESIKHYGVRSIPGRVSTLQGWKKVTMQADVAAISRNVASCAKLSDQGYGTWIPPWGGPAQLLRDVTSPPVSKSLIPVERVNNNFFFDLMFDTPDEKAQQLCALPKATEA